MKVFQLTPDRSVDNKKGNEFIRSLHDLFEPLYKRIKPKERRIQPLEKFWYIIRLTTKEITFYTACSASTEVYLQQRLSRYWPKATIKESELPGMKQEDSLACEMKYKRHNIFSLSADWREDTVPIASILNVVPDMKENDEARVIVCIEPYNRTTWADWSEKALQEFKDGKTPSRRGIAGKLTLKTVAQVLDTVMTEVQDVAETIFETESEVKERDRRRNKKRGDLEKREILLDGKLDKATLNKQNEPVFKTRIYITSHSKHKERRLITLRSLSNAFSELVGDNELKRHDVSSKIIKKLNEWRVPLDFDVNIMSASEVGKLWQLPTASIQEQYKEILKTIEHRETDLPDRITHKGIKFATVTFKGVKRDIYIPVDDYDELCLPRIVIGGMGTGKTKGFGGNFGVGALVNGFSVISIDVAKDELGHEIDTGALENGIGKSKLIHLEFGEKVYHLDWVEGMQGKRAANKLAGEVLNFFNLHGAEAGVETSRYIRLAGKTVGELGLNLYDVYTMFTDKDFRIKHVKQIKNEQLKKEWDSFERLTDPMKGKVTEPVLNRLDMLLGDEYLCECLKGGEKLDFTKWLTGGYHVRIFVPKGGINGLGAEAVDVLIDFLMGKIELAMFARPEEEQVPCFVIMDEPHQFASCSARWERMAVETRKWRLGLVWMFHSWDQVPRKLTETIKAAGAHYHLYTTSKSILRDLQEEINPFTIEEALKTPRHFAINVIRSGGLTITPFIAKMLKPPSA